jgi:hypothetical protein
VEIPYFFGGDGSTILVPGVMLNETLKALASHNANTLRNFKLEFHIGSISIREIYDAGHQLKIGKFLMENGSGKPIAIGDGLQYAEQMIKQGRRDREEFLYHVPVDLNGLECRWDKILAPEEREEVVCYLIEATEPSKQLEVYSEVLQKIDQIYGTGPNRHPLTTKALRLIPGYSKLRKEILVKYGQFKQSAFGRSFLTTMVGWIFFQLKGNKSKTVKNGYLEQLISNTDTLHIDGRISIVMTGKKENRLVLLEYLRSRELGGDLIYGHHISNESIITCYIQNRNNDHVHFLDGGDGGFTSASIEFKKKRRVNYIQREVIAH